MSQNLLDFLIKRNVITIEQGAEIVALAEANDIAPAQALVDLGYAGDNSSVIKIMAETFGFQFVDLAGMDLGPGGLSSKLTVQNAKQFPAVTLYEDHGELLVAIPLELAKSSIQTKEDIRSTLNNIPIRFVVSTRKDIMTAIDRVYRIDQELATLSNKAVKSEYTDTKAELGNSLPDEIQSQSEVVRFVDLVISQAVKDGASDIHFDPSEQKLQIRYRIDGVLYNVSEAPKFMIPEIVSRIKILAQLDISQTRIPQDGRISHYVDGKKIDLRLATLPSIYGEKVVMRVLDNNQAALSLQKLGFTQKNLRRFQTAALKPYGMLLVTGPTGSGKSTTLYSALNEISSPDINVITVEDPIEYQLKGITQVQVNNKANITFDKVLRTILRADPDVILVGEIRDLETANTAMQAGLTGHMVFSTLHTNDAASAIPRLADMGVEPFVTSSTLQGVVSQRLIRKLCQKCKEAYTPTETELQVLNYTKTIEGEETFFRPKGCAACAHTGFRGRLAIHEILLNDANIRDAILKNKTVSEIYNYAVAGGMVPMKQDGFEKVATGLTSFEEVIRAVI